MISGLPRPAIAGSASRAPASASFCISGSGLISLLSGMKPETITPGAIGSGNAARRSPPPPPCVPRRAARRAAPARRAQFDFRLRDAIRHFAVTDSAALGAGIEG